MNGNGDFLHACDFGAHLGLVAMPTALSKFLFLLFTQNVNLDVDVHLRLM